MVATESAGAELALDDSIEDLQSVAYSFVTVADCSSTSPTIYIGEVQGRDSTDWTCSGEWVPPTSVPTGIPECSDYYQVRG